LKRLGVAYSGAAPRASGGFAVAGGRKHTLPGGFVSLVSTSLLGLSAKLELARLLSSFARLDAEPVRAAGWEAWLQRNARHEGVRSLLRALTRLTTYCDAATELSAGDVIEQIQMALASGVLYLDGGWQTLVDGLRAAAVAEGVAVEEAAAVRAIEVSGVVEGVRLDDGSLVGARAVVAAVPPDMLVRLAPMLTTKVRSRLDDLVPVRAACLDLTLSALPSPSATFALGVDVPLYFSVHSAVAKLAPAPRAVVHLMKYLSPGSDAGSQTAEKELEGLMDLVQPSWRSLVADRRFLPAMTVSHALPSLAQGGRRGRPAVDVAAVGGLYAAGDWVGAEGLLADAAAASAEAAAHGCNDYLDASSGRAVRAA
jgi:phytoene dehydrogenase-like protein